MVGLSNSGRFGNLKGSYLMSFSVSETDAFSPKNMKLSSATLKKYFNSSVSTYFPGK
jgi:hypothetical protein